MSKIPLALLGIPVAAYLLGSIPFGLLLTRLFGGVDVRKSGSGNIGATNVARVAGPLAGILTLLFDAGKGAAAVWVAGRVSNESATWMMIACLAALAGHCFPVWLKFKGGKGVATSAGALFALTAVGGLIGLGIWIVIFWLTRYVSVASITAALLLPVVILVIGWRNESAKVIFYFSVCAAAGVIWRHRSNLSRLMHGTEPRFTRK